MCKRLHACQSGIVAPGRAWCNVNWSPVTFRRFTIAGLAIVVVVVAAAPGAREHVAGPRSRDTFTPHSLTNPESEDGVECGLARRGESASAGPGESG
jgi:hypothetical protein